MAFAADYYQRSVGEVALPALPQALRDAARWQRLFAAQPRFRLTVAGRTALPDALPPRAAALRRLAAALADARTLDLSDARGLHPKAAATLAAWQAEGWVDIERDADAGAAAGSAVCASLAGDAPMGGAADIADGVFRPVLTDEQAQAVESIAAAHGFSPFLLHGVTGSGKTEVYLRPLDALSRRGRTRRRWCWCPRST